MLDKLEQIAPHLFNKNLKFKFIANNTYTLDLIEDEKFKQVECPFTYKRKYPQGEYIIRGYRNNIRTVYFHIENKWFTFDQYKRSETHDIVEACKYELFPQLPKKEWNKLKKIPLNRFNKQWKVYIEAYKLWEQQRYNRIELKKRILL